MDIQLIMAQPPLKRHLVDPDTFYSSDSRSSLDDEDDLWLSKYSTLEAFQSLIQDKILKPCPSVDFSVQVVNIEDALEFPVSRCRRCVEMLKESGLLQAVSKINWQFVHTGMYDLTEEDQRLFQLVTAVRSILKYGCYNGHIKQVSANMVYLLRSFTICSKHNLHMSVFSPSKSTEVGGLVSKVGFQDGESFEAKQIKGIPDLSVVAEEEPYLFLAIGKNKKRKLTWREVDNEVAKDTSSEIRQLMLYLVAAHFKRFSISVSQHRS